MKSETISLQRRHLMIAGAVTAVTAGSLYAAAQTFGSKPAARAGAAAGTSLLASGRIVTAEGNVFAALRMREADLDKHLQGNEEGKDAAREIAVAAGVPVVPRGGTTGPGAWQGPVLVKAAAGVLAWAAWLAWPP